MTEPEEGQVTTEETAPVELGFAGCVAEIDSIIKALEADRIDVDELASRVTRATELIEWCRNRLNGTRIEVEEILDRFEVSEADTETD